ncbi:uncharacterized protein LOC107047361 [Diachasma alloeum]|uniref:uncharacterized protein LOC107038250 n=1 Tax=Diachasma alloeum TaxID=454923 RepID=UPI0007384C47|nr:uncharacterized protein LOC107038250 [Diachasma alloeum]XP_015125613.1 uncharacterized protein LOC107047361 [Diachasma alloeum]
MTADKKNEMEQFLSYYETNWIQSVGPEELSCYKNSGATDAYQRSMLKILLQFNERDITLWKFMERIIHCQEKIHKELQARPQSVPHAWTPKVYPLADDNSSLPKQWDKYHNRAIDEARLMQVAVFCLRTSFLDNLANPDEYPKTHQLFQGAGYEERALMMPIFTAREPAQNLEKLLRRINPNARRVRARRQVAARAANRAEDGVHNAGNNAENFYAQRPNVVPDLPLHNGARANQDAEDNIGAPRQPQHENGAGANEDMNDGLNDGARRQIIGHAIEQAPGDLRGRDERIFDDERGNIILDDDPIFDPPEDDYGHLNAIEGPIQDFALLPDDEEREQIEREVRQHLEDNDGRICVCCHTNPANVIFYRCRQSLV